MSLLCVRKYVAKQESLCRCAGMCKDTKVLEWVMECSRIRVERNHIRWIDAGPVSVESVRRSPRQAAFKTVGRDVVCAFSECLNYVLIFVLFKLRY